MINKNLKEDIQNIEDDIWNLTISIREEQSDLDIKSCNELLALLTIFESDLKSMKRIAQDQKDRLVMNERAKPQNPNPEGKVIQLPLANDQLLSVIQAAEKLGCTRQTVYTRHIPGGLKVVYPAGKQGNKKIRASDLANYIANLQTA